MHLRDHKCRWLNAAPVAPALRVSRHGQAGSMQHNSTASSSLGFAASYTRHASMDIPDNECLMKIDSRYYWKSYTCMYYEMTPVGTIVACKAACNNNFPEGTQPIQTGYVCNGFTDFKGPGLKYCCFKSAGAAALKPIGPWDGDLDSYVKG